MFPITQEKSCVFFHFVHSAHEMSHFSTALTEIVERSFESKWADLARRSGVDSSVISRFAAGKITPSIDGLGSLAAAMNRHDRKQLFLAAARDRIPPAYQDEIFGDEDPASQLLRAKLSPDLAAVIRYLESNAMSDELTATYLRRIASWIFQEPAAATTQNTLRVAEDPVQYPAKKNNGLGKA